jgi:hypothetical protein
MIQTLKQKANYYLYLANMGKVRFDRFKSRGRKNILIRELSVRSRRRKVFVRNVILYEEERVESYMFYYK